MKTDVLLVGAGPTGLMLANQLARRGLRPLIIDRHPGPSLQTRALGVQARTLEIYAKMGLAEQAIELGKRGNGAHLWSEGQQIGAVSLSDAGSKQTPYPYILVLGQDDNERLLGDLLRKWDIAVQWNTELVGLAQEDGRVTVKVRRQDGTLAEIEVAWVAGCDGAHSAVRGLNAIEFEGAEYEHVFFVADTQATGSMVPDELNVYLWRTGFHLFFPMRGIDHWRLVGILPPQMRAEEGLTFDDVIPAVRQEAGAELNFIKCSWFSTYRIHHRRAVRFRKDRCFLLGDAAHIHSPVGAQGMNTGLQDAYNLAWKLALVVRQRADVGLLDSFEAERIPVAQRLLDTTDRAFLLVASDSWLAGLFRTRILARIMAFAMGVDRIRTLAFRTISQIGISYRDGPLSESTAALPGTAPRAGDRFPWLRLKLEGAGEPVDVFAQCDDTRFNLIVIGQPRPPQDMPALGELLRVHVVASDPANDRELVRAQIPQPSFYLLRPDGHVGLAGARFDAALAARYVSERLRIAHGAA